MSAFLLLALAGAHPSCTEGTEEVPPLCPANIPAIRAVIVERSGKGDHIEDDERLDCSSFRLSAPEVRRYFRDARRVNPQAADATLDRSPCYVAGRVTFANGQTGKWRIEQYKVGRLTIGKRSLLLYAPDAGEPFIG
ncbi:hypothetical protein [Sphingomonas immobilis]|uniref:Lipoprotein n=1 Tax=Sphingomonas immobilis TaxID=3063997 RepID=A0ABT8ZV69_9SPHN|nr:hypothetical protein [Sphingomonas sp. CA1-15]MDO7840890.1 hypothetical protein [Sphingomonas sp. CA1-15]